MNVFPTDHDFENLLTDTLFSSEKLHINQARKGKRIIESKEWRFSPPDFFAKWFREYGNAYYFLFRKNLKVTNIQFAELLALIRAHNSSRETKEPSRAVQFLSVSGFYVALQEIVDSFPRSEKDPRGRYALLSRMYYSLLSRHVVVEAFYGSCAVFIPPNLEINLPLICAQSGYIHSCGKNIFTRKIDKAKKGEFFDALDRYLKKRDEKNKSPFFIVYAHEDFTRTEKPEKKEYLRDGLDDVKIFIEKFYMDAERLIDIVQDMRSKYEEKLLFHPVGKKPSDTVKEAVQEDKQFDHSHTVWLLVDHSLGRAIRQRGEDRFYICYEQHYVNENPFQFFDENKPAWFSHTTIPHTLLSAMINITGMSRPRDGRLQLADPFAGTGTTWVEAIKLNHIDVKCTDKAPIAPLLASDNLDFFCASFEQLRYWKEQLESLVTYLLKPNMPDDYPSAALDVIKDYNWAIEFYGKLGGKKGDYIAALEKRNKISALTREPFLRRLFFYLTLRTVGRSNVAIKRGSQEWSFAYATQAHHLAGQIGLLQEVRLREQSLVEKIEKFSIYNSLYSLGCSISLSELERRSQQVRRQTDEQPIDREPGNFVVGVYDVREDQNLESSSIKPQSCDVIITDPPYGFNTDDDLEDLAELYADVIQKMIHALKQDGQLVICLLDRSHTGRRSPYFTHKELITQQVLSLVERAIPKREVIVPAYAVPEQSELFRPPYYWESERALRRAILHFRIRFVEEKEQKDS